MPRERVWWPQWIPFFPEGPPATSVAWIASPESAGPLNYLHRNTESLRVFAILVATLTFLCSCGPRSLPAAAGDPPGIRDVTDETGRAIKVAARPKRIVSLAPSLTEIVYAVGAGDRLVGDTTYCDYPEAAKHVTKVGDTLAPNAENIIALKPDLILVSTASQLESFARQLDERGIPVYVSDPKDLDGVFASIQKIGELLNEPQQASDLLSNLKRRADFVSEKVRSLPRPRVFYQVSAEPLYTAGRTSFVTDLIKRAGGASVTGDIDGAWLRYSNEAAAAAQPDVIVMPTGDSMGQAANMKVADALKRSPAVTSNRVYPINGDLLSRPGPRLLDGLDQLARAFHPTAFK
jgi:iron complex transport system substrate-binding protein